MTKLIVANWKLNPSTIREAKEIFVKIKRGSLKLRRARGIICPPAVFLPALVPGAGISLGAQDLFTEAAGAYTGRLAASMLKSAGAEYSIIGHSELRAAGDTDDVVNRKLKAALRENLTVVLCVGETERDPDGKYLNQLKDQLTRSLAGVPKRSSSQLVVAYEPIWAIGSAAVAADTPDDFRHQAIFIRKVLAAQFGKDEALTMPVLYGGSVTSKNAGSFLVEGQADGLLIGRESLRSDKFIEILKLAHAAV